MFLLLASIFIALLVVSNIIASKIIMVGNLIGPAAVLCYALTFAISDTIAEIWGKERTKYVVTLGFLASVISAIMIKIAILMPPAPFWQNQQEYKLILGSNIRIVIASMLAYLTSQYHDVWAFHFWKKLTNEKHLWIRNNLSTLVSQMIDTIIFIVVAFYGTGTPLMSIIIGQYTIKLIIAICDTPLVYILVNFVKRYINFEGKYKVTS
ncbi:transporter [Thermohalobacter berrensis]|uniref:Probable queuosine precursor transporter n=2 Tax=Thermohalobacter berrensis TaxID=99594 RepID=A0A419SWI3_9FIRM|nr:transporter [Thermohalobacter berrensis]